MSISKKLIGGLREVRAKVREKVRAEAQSRFDSFMSREPKNEVIRIPSPYEVHPQYVDIHMKNLRFERCFVTGVDFKPSDPETYHPHGGRITITYSYSELVHRS